MIDLTNKIDRKYWLSYQRDAIMEEARLELWEKSIRIGATYARIFRGVRRRMLGQGNLLYTSVNERMAKEAIVQAREFCRIFDVVGAGDVEEYQVWNPSENRSETAFEIRFKPVKGKRDKEVSFKAFSSNPDSLRGQGGDVDIDELTSHKQPEAMLAAAGGRAMWGFAIGIWTSHKGVGSCFNRMLQEARAKGEKSRWKIRSTSLYDALDAGLLEKINTTRKLSLTREDFIADTIDAVGGQAAFEEECLLKPRSSGDAALRWDWIDKAKTEYTFFRKDMEGDGPFDIAGFLALLHPELVAADRLALGYDVARTGHLSAVSINRRSAGKWRLAGLVTMHDRRFSGQREVIEAAMRKYPAMVGAGDKTGLGMQVCEELTQRFGEARFTGCNFGQLKPAIGTRLVKTFEDGLQELPAGRADEDIAFDLHAIQREDLPSGRAHFTESQNPVNKASHCDIGWSIGLSLLVGCETSGVGIYVG